MNRVLAVIPARIGSSRLPRKPLQPLLGTPLVVWVWRRAREMPFLDRVLVATDSVDVVEACRREGADAVLTWHGHPSGTHRVRQAAGLIEGRFGVVVNIQGDEPLVSAEAVRAAVSMVRAGFDVGTCAAPIGSEEEFRDPSVVKVVRDAAGSALYFSRAPIPHRRDDAPPAGCGDYRSREHSRLRHVGVYAYTVDALARWAGCAPSELEAEEKLEQLRALEHGMRIGVAIVDEADGGVDTPEDLERMEQRMRALGVEPESAGTAPPAEAAGGGVATGGAGGAPDE